MQAHSPQHRWFSFGFSGNIKGKSAPNQIKRIHLFQWSVGKLQTGNNSNQPESSFGSPHVLQSRLIDFGLWCWWFCREFRWLCCWNCISCQVISKSADFYYLQDLQGCRWRLLIHWRQLTNCLLTKPQHCRNLMPHTDPKNQSEATWPFNLFTPGPALHWLCLNVSDALLRETSHTKQRPWQERNTVLCTAKLVSTIH